MVKVKNKKRNLAEVVNEKRGQQNKKTLNPFEVHINNQKIRVLGQKHKNDRGLPGVSRSKALQKRKHTLLPEYKVLNKTNKFLDKRIGEHNKSLTFEDKNVARYTAVRVKHHNKKSIFNLADDEILTHKGQTLSEIEKFDDPRSDDEESLDGQSKSGNLTSKFVEDVHFGGGVLKKADGSKSHKDLIDQLILESKKRKAEKQKQKEATLELTEKLDTEWKDLLPIVNKSKKDKEESKQKEVDDYDKVMRELRFEARGNPSDKLKTEDEIAKEEKEKLERLEKERLERMHGTVSDLPKPTHRSADDLDDNFAYDSDTPDVTLSYNEKGESNIVLDEKKVEDEEPLDDESEDEDVETDSEDNLSDLKDSDDSDEENENVEDEEISDVEEDIDEEENEVEQKIEDKDSAVETDESDEVKDKKIKSNKHKLENEVTSMKKAKTNTDCSSMDSEEIKKDLLKRKDMMEQARKELPFTYSLPESYEELQKTLQDQSSDHQSVIIERMIKCNHPSLKEGNKEALGNLFVYLLQHISDISCDAVDDDSIKKCWQIFTALTPQLFDLAQLNPENAHSSLAEVIKEKEGEFRKARKKFPNIDVILYLKLVSCLFSTSDFRHRVVTPCLVFMEQMLTKCKVKTRADVAYGLFIVTLIAEYTVLSKRYLPAAIRFLCGVLHMAIPNNSAIKVLPPFKANTNLVIHTPSNEDNLKLDITDLLNTKDFNDSFSIKSLHVTIGLLKNFYNNLQPLSSCPEIFDSVLNYLKELPVKNYPKVLGNVKKGFEEILEEYKSNRRLQYVVMEKKRPKALRLYEPNIVKIYDGKRFKVQSKEKAERDKLLHKIKKEKKGALREIRRDKAFLGRIKIKEKIQSDKERKEKVKKIYSEAAMQQSELNAIDRKKAKKK